MFRDIIILEQTKFKKLYFPTELTINIPQKTSVEVIRTLSPTLACGHLGFLETQPTLSKSQWTFQILTEKKKKKRLI